MHGSLDWGAGASLCGGDTGHDGVDVVAAAAPSGLSAAVATGGTTHVVFLWLVVSYWLTLNWIYTLMGITPVYANAGAGVVGEKLVSM